MFVNRAEIASKGFLSPEMESVRRQVRADLAESVAATEAVSDRLTAGLFAVDGSNYERHQTLALAFWIRCLRACQGCLILAERGMAPEALSVLRSGFEFLFFGVACLRDSTVFAGLAGGHQRECRKQARAMLEEGTQGELTDQQIEQLGEVLGELDNEHSGPALDAYTAARRAGLGFVYASAYRGLSMMASHATIAGTDCVLEEQPDGTAKAVFGPSMDKVAFAYTLTARCLELGEQGFAPLLNQTAPREVGSDGEGG